MEKYELLYILPAKYTEAEAKVMSDKIGGLVKAAGGVVSETHDMGKRKLAYPIKHARNGNFILNYFEAESAVLAKINDTLRMSPDILRHLIVTRDPLITKIPSLADEPEGERRPMMRRPDERDVRAERPAVSAVRTVPVQQTPVATKEAPITMEELDKKLDQILTEEVL